MRQVCDELSVDYTHFRNRKADDVALASAVAGVDTWDELLTRLGHARDSGSARASVRAHCARLGLDVSHIGARPVPQPADPLHGAVDLVHLRHAGSFLVAAACALSGHRVSWPLEPAPYDLLVDSGASGLQRIQVKTTTVRSRGTWVCDVSRSTYVPGGTKRRALYGPDEVDAFGVVDGDLQVHLIPARLVVGSSSLSLRKYAAFRIGLGAPGR